MDGHFDGQATAAENMAGLLRAAPFNGSVDDLLARIGATPNARLTPDQWEAACSIVEPDAVEEGAEY